MFERAFDYPLESRGYTIKDLSVWKSERVSKSIVAFIQFITKATFFFNNIVVLLL